MKHPHFQDSSNSNNVTYIYNMVVPSTYRTKRCSRFACYQTVCLKTREIYGILTVQHGDSCIRHREVYGNYGKMALKMTLLQGHQLLKSQTTTEESTLMTYVWNKHQDGSDVGLAKGPTEFISILSNQTCKMRRTAWALCGRMPDCCMIIQ
jgi:hypothetical protein